MRPVYETPHDIERERAVARLICVTWACIPKKLPRLHCADYLLVRGGKPAGWAEIKTRTHSFGTYSTYIISERKWRALSALSRVSGVPFFLFVRFLDGTYYINGLDTDYSVVVGGRNDRNDIKDIEPVAGIDLRHFRICAS